MCWRAAYLRQACGRAAPGCAGPVVWLAPDLWRHADKEAGVGEFVRLETADGIGTIRLERPPMNALNTQVQEELRAAAIQAAGDDEVRAVIVYGGEKVFAAGADIKEMAEMSYVDMSARAGALSSAFDTV